MIEVIRRSLSAKAALACSNVRILGAILLVRKREDYYDEEEVVVDPYKLAKVEMMVALAGY